MIKNLKNIKEHKMNKKKNLFLINNKKFKEY